MKINNTKTKFESRTVNLEPEDWSWIDDFAKVSERTATQVVRLALREFRDRNRGEV